MLNEQRITEGAYGSRWYQDLNSRLYLFIRWGCLINQMFWTIMIIVGQATEHHSLSVASYCLAVLPLWLGVTAENFAHFTRPRDESLQEGLNRHVWTGYRVLTSLVCLVLWCVWFSTHQGSLLIASWVLIMVAVLFENSVSCNRNDYCCNECYNDDYRNV